MAQTWRPNMPATSVLSWNRRGIAKHFPRMRIARSADSDVFTTARGFRRATSISATLTGLGGDCFIIDDPLKPIDAQSDAQRNHLNDWFSSTLMSRLDNKVTGSIIVVMQRVHLNDLTGYLLENSDGWTVLSLPAIAEVREEIEDRARQADMSASRARHCIQSASRWPHWKPSAMSSAPIFSLRSTSSRRCRRAGP